MELSVDVKIEQEQQQEQQAIYLKQNSLSQSSLNEKIFRKNSEEEKNTTSITIDKEKSNNTKITRKYSRGELFKFGKLMKDSLTKEELIRFEEADWTQYNLDLLDNNNDTDMNSLNNNSSSKRINKETQIMFSSQRTITNKLERQTSELGQEFRSLGSSCNDNQQRSLGGRMLLSRNNSSGYKSSPVTMNKISRMTSSPSIKFNNNNNNNSSSNDVRRLSNDQENFEGLSGHVKAKYAKLIESFSNINNKKSPLSRNSSNDLKQPERPTQLFGPLRKEDYTHRYRDDSRRNSSDGPQSLPYIHSTTTSSNSSCINKATRWKTNSNDIVKNYSSLMDDYNSASPIKRFTKNKSMNEMEDEVEHEKRQTKNSNTSPANEEDDFDITSLLSITVLSDIKTIRQDLQQYSHHGSNLRNSHHLSNNNNNNNNNNERSHSSLNLSNNNNNHLSIGNEGGGNIALKTSSGRKFGINDHYRENNRPPPALTRARTATDFTYNGRQQHFNNNYHHYNEQHGNHINASSYHNRMSGISNQSSSYYNTDYRSSGPESLPIIVGQSGRHTNAYQSSQHYNNNNNFVSSQNLYGAREMARTSSQQNLSQLQKQKNHVVDSSSERNLDENTAQIIKTFKEQVKARAREESKQQQQQQQQQNVADKRQEKNFPLVSSTSGSEFSSKEKAIKCDEINGVESSLGKQAEKSRSSLSKEERAASETVSRISGDGGCENFKGDLLNSKNDNINKHDGEKSQKEDLNESLELHKSRLLEVEKMAMPTREVMTLKSGIDNSIEPIASSNCSSKQDGVIKQVASNIPRLLSLHKQKLSNGSLLLVSDTSVADNRTKIEEDANKNASPTSSGLASLKSVTTSGPSSTTKTTKFVSQYKLLRGKSLADEVADSS